MRVESVRVQATPNNRNNTEYQQNRYVDGAIELRTTGGRTMSGNEWVSSRDSDGVWGDPRNELHYTTNPSSQYLLIGKKLQYYDSTEIRVRFYGDRVIRSSSTACTRIPRFHLKSIRSDYCLKSPSPRSSSCSDRVQRSTGCM